MDFRDSSNLGEIPVNHSESTISGKPYGTKLILSGLRKPEDWQAEEYLLSLQRKLSGMIFPFQVAQDFRVRLEVDGKKLELAEIAKKVRETALLKYVFEFRRSSIANIGSGATQLLPAEQKGRPSALKFPLSTR